MANPWSISDAEKQTSVTTSGDLLTAIAGAKPGEVVTLTQTVPHFPLTLNTPKAGSGICVKLPVDQPLNLIANAQNLRTEIVGGVYTNNSGQEYSIDLTNASRLALRGGTISQGSIIFKAATSTDLVVEDMLTEWAKEDFFQISACNRFKLNRIYGRNMIKGQKMRYYADGRQPVDNIGAQSPQNAANGWWDDTAHNDGGQLKSNATSANSPVGGPSTAQPSTDFLVKEVDLHVLGAGFVMFDYNPYSDLGLPSMERGVIEDCNLRVVDPSAIFFKGNDLTVRRNTFGPHPTDPGGSPVSCTLARLNGASRVRGGENIAVGAGSFFAGGSGIDLAGAEAGDAVVPPDSPLFGLRRLPWAPAAPRPTYTPHAVAPVVVTAPNVYWAIGDTAYNVNASGTPPAPTTGTWLTAGQGQTKGFEGSTGEWRWMRSGVAISGATGRIYQVQAIDLGTAITVETRRTNAHGTGPWKSSAAINPA